MNNDTYLTIDSGNIVNDIKTVLANLGVDKYTISHSRGYGTTEKVTVALTAFENFSKVGNDNITPQILFFNSYGGECALSIHVGFIRWACSNGMIAGDSFFSRRIVHRVGPTATAKLAELEAGISDAVAYMRDEFGDAVAEMTAQPLTEEQMISVTASLPQLSKRSKEAVINKIVKPGLRREADRDNNLWILWNLVNEQVRVAGRSQYRTALKNVGLFNDVKALSEVA